jgi:GMP synthase (glutamine-hydrolysing)
VRELGVYSEIHPFHYSIEHIKQFQPVGIILSGGPMSVYEQNAPKPDPRIFDLGIPILGICYGLQLFADRFGGKVNSAARREYGKADLQIDDHSDLFTGLDAATPVWMSHGDALSQCRMDLNRLRILTMHLFARSGIFRRKCSACNFIPK